MGEKNLFFRDGNGVIKEIKPICVLDFYVHESVQRGGIGRVTNTFKILGTLSKNVVKGGERSRIISL